MDEGMRRELREMHKLAEDQIEVLYQQLQDSVGALGGLIGGILERAHHQCMSRDHWEAYCEAFQQREVSRFALARVELERARRGVQQ